MFNKSYNVAAAERANKELAHTSVKYSIRLLDDSVETLNLSTETYGMNLLDSVCDLLELLERDYFGIQYRIEDSHSNSSTWKWLKMDKLVRKQIKDDFMSKTYYLRVRFVPVDVNQMLEIYTRYQLFLQIKQDICNGRINCPKEVAVQLAGCALQSELGDFNLLKSGYVGEFRFIREQTPGFESDVANFHKTLRGLRAEEAELKFLTIAKQLIQYGCDMYNCELMDKPIQFGFNAIGVSMFPSEGNEPFIVPWSALDRILNKNKTFLITVLNIQSIIALLEGGASYSVQTGTKAKLSIFRDKLNNGFKLIFPTSDEAKEVWKSCIESHSFFRVRDPKLIQGSNSVKRSHSFFKLSSVPTLFSGRRTLPELLDIRRRSRTLERSFIRTPSKRFTKKNAVSAEKQSIISSTESHRPSGVVHGKGQKPNLGSLNSTKSKVDTRKEVDISENESSEHSGVDDIEPEPGQLRPKSFMTQSVRLENTNQFIKSSTMHASMPRKGPNRPAKSLFVDEDKKEANSSKGESTNPRAVANQKSSSTMSEVKSGLTKSQSLVKSRLSGSLSSMKNPLSATNGAIHQSTDKLTDMDSYVEISMKALDNKFGFTIRGGLDTGSHVIVTKVSSGSAANICVPNLFEGDQIIKINGKFADDLSNDEIKEIIRSTGQKKDNLLVLTVKPRLYIAEESVTNDDVSTEEDDTSSPVSTKNDLRTEIRLLEESLKNGTAVASFEKLYKQMQGLSMNEAKKTENISKNRYKDILPYDQTRIIIRTNEYINANLIKFEIPKSPAICKYIAAQGPLTHTANDFLTMIWENKTQLVVMLTDLQEKGRSKCFKYWPNCGDTTKLPNNLQITCESETIHSTYAIREMKLKKASDMRRFTHLQYLYWPDHDVPQKMDEFTSFMKTMKQIRSNKTEATVVHCSAGIGRTGVVITMDIAISHIELKQPFSVIAIVKEIRNQRAMLIQSQKQYEFVCRAIINYYSHHSK